MFDISAEGSDLWLKSFSIHVDEPGTQVPVKVYVKEASYVGSENSLNDWTLICSTTLTSAGPQAPTNIPLGVCTEHQIPQNERHGVYIAVDADADAHMIYTSVDPSPNGVHATTERFVIHEASARAKIWQTRTARVDDGTESYTMDRSDTYKCLIIVLFE